LLPPVISATFPSRFMRVDRRGGEARRRFEKGNRAALRLT
jgi:hypothetical protein